jgi:hypothetical protein
MGNAERTDGGGGTLTLSASEKSRISAAMDDANENCGWDISSGHKFFLCDQLEKTDFKKAGRGGIMGHRYLDLRSYLLAQKKMSVIDVATTLNGKTW